MTNIVLGGSTPSDGFELKSARFNVADGGYLSWTPSATATSGKIFTVSCWVKRGRVDQERRIFTAADDGANPEPRTEFAFYATSQLVIGGNPTGNTWYMAQTTSRYRDPSAWYHIVWSMDTSQVTAAERSTLYVNGVEITDFDSNTLTGGTSIPQDSTVLYGQSGILQTVGAYAAGVAGGIFDGYIAEFYFIDGTELPPSYFAETNEDTNQWQPKNPTDIKETLTFGTNGFYLPFSNDALATSFEDGSGNAPVIDAFTSTGSATWTCPSGVTEIEVLIVAGGGGGGSRNYGGGGGAGGIVHDSDYTVVPGTVYDLTVGNYGSYVVENAGNDGEDSVWNVNAEGSGITLTAGGGGGGGNNTNSASAGGSGGGSGAVGSGASSDQADFTGATSYGNDGANGGGSQSDAGGGGGGAAANGTSGAQTTVGVGGAGQSFSTFTSYGSSGYFGGGGQACNRRLGIESRPAAAVGGGGLGAMGNSASGGTSGPSTAGAANTGGGGGGGSSTTRPDGSNGGTGVVLIKYIGDYTVTANGNVKNERITNHPVTASGNAHIIGPKIGSSAIAFDGDVDSLSVPDHADWNFGTGDFTIEFWVNFNSIHTGANGFGLIGQYTDSNNYWMIHQSSSTIGWNAYTGGSQSGDYTLLNWTAQPNRWYHYAIVRDGNYQDHFIDGVQQRHAQIDSHSYPNATGVLGIGDNRHGSFNELNGYMDEIRISNSARYTVSTTNNNGTQVFTPHTTAHVSDSNTKLLIHSNTTMGSTTFDDDGATDHTITANGNVEHIVPKIGTGMGVFDGSGDILSVGASTDFPDTGDYTIEGWFYANAIASQQCLFGGGASSNTGYIRIENNNWSIMPQWDGTEHGMNGVASTNTWYHVACVRNGANFNFYVNGTSLYNSSSAAVINWDQGFEIGDTPADSGGTYGHTPWNGYIDNFRISNIARYTSNFTPSTTAHKDDKDTVFLAHMDGGGGIDPETNLPTLPGQGTYFWDASTNAIFYDAAGLPTNKSLIAFDGTGDYLTAPPGTDFAFGTGNFTVESWVKFNNTGASDYYQGIFGNVTTTGGGYAGNWGARMDPDGTNLIAWYYGSSTSDKYNFTWEPGSGNWYHIAFSRSGTDLKCFIDGTQIGSTQTDSTSYVSTLATCMGSYVNASDLNGNLNGYMDQFRVSNSARYTSNFTAPTTPFTTDANTKLLVQSDFGEGGLGADHSGNHNYFTPTNLTASDMTLDSPLNNFATLNPLFFRTSYKPTYAEGNLKATPIGNNQAPSMATIGGLQSGKWYFEFYVGGSAQTDVGIVEATPPMTYIESNTALTSRIYRNGGNKESNGSASSYGASYTTGDIIGVALNITDGELTFYKNNATQNVAFSDIASAMPSGGWTFFIEQVSTSNAGIVNFGQDSSFAGNKTAQGNGGTGEDFYYTPPSGFLALCTSNLSDPEIALPTDHFNTLLYSGDNTNNRAITGVGFSPGLLWLKKRNGTGNNKLYGVVPGIGSSGQILRLTANTDSVVQDTTDEVDSLNSDGFTIDSGGGDNASGGTYVAWNWKAGGTPTVDNSAGVGATPTAGSVKIDGSNFGSALAGSIAATRLSANTTSGMSIVSYVGNDTAGATIAHGLSQAPDLIIAKDRTSAYSWKVGSSVMASTSPWNYWMQLDDAEAAVNGSADIWDDTAPTASVFTIGDHVTINTDTDNFIAYCFHSVEGYSKIGSYEGNGIADGAFIYTGFRPAWTMIKSVDTGEGWLLGDNKRSGYNPVGNNWMRANVNDAEVTNNSKDYDYVSNGIKFRDGSGLFNVTSTFLYIAIAETPFKTSNAR